MRKVTKEEIIKLVGETYFYEALEDFHYKHGGQNCEIIIDKEMDMPIKAIYHFEPLTVVSDNLAVEEAIRKANTGLNKNE